jgi:hypothetical protein
VPKRNRQDDSVRANIVHGCVWRPDTLYRAWCDSHAKQWEFGDLFFQDDTESENVVSAVSPTGNAHGFLCNKDRPLRLALEHRRLAAFGRPRRDNSDIAVRLYLMRSRQVPRGPSSIGGSQRHTEEASST